MLLETVQLLTSQHLLLFPVVHRNVKTLEPPLQQPHDPPPLQLHRHPVLPLPLPVRHQQLLPHRVKEEPIPLVVPDAETSDIDSFEEGEAALVGVGLSDHWDKAEADVVSELEVGDDFLAGVDDLLHDGLFDGFGEVVSLGEYFPFLFYAVEEDDASVGVGEGADGLFEFLLVDAQFEDGLDDYCVGEGDAFEADVAVLGEVGGAAQALRILVHRYDLVLLLFPLLK